MKKRGVKLSLSKGKSKKAISNVISKIKKHEKTKKASTSDAISHVISKIKKHEKTKKSTTPGAISKVISKIKNSKNKTKKQITGKSISNVFDTKKSSTSRKLLKTYKIDSAGIPVTVNVYQQKGEFVPLYTVQLSAIGKTTGIILEKIREELIDRVNLGIIDITDTKRSNLIEGKFSNAIRMLIKKYFPALSEQNERFLTSYLVKKSLGMGDVELLMSDKNLEEIAINASGDPVWVFHKEFGWLKTNIILENEAQVRHYATMIGRKVNRQITILEPLMDANLPTGDRVNATLMPISSTGNTMTIRKFASKPWTITDFIRVGTISTSAAALIWECVHYEMSAIIAGGTASGKTSMLNVVSNFFPPNQRIISIEDTREIRLPKFLHWVPMVTRLPNNEGKGGIEMLDLLVNSLRMRPDRIVVGEIRRKKEAEVLFESIHTGHSVYATIHANNTNETITRITSPPIEVPKSMLPAVSLILVQYRNRRSGLRRTFELSEIKENGDANVLMRYDTSKDILKKIGNSITIKHNLALYTGASHHSIKRELHEKEAVLKWLVKQKISTVDEVGRVMAEYYTNKKNLMKFVRSNKPFR
ncbi:type II/IV secretion system ATPase subunit [Candidatus Woesearchaeota archaeon]|nr:type II/IV secretion system ATPase subunit [Candidatus Woesearchaeota archaeon]